MPTKMLLLQAMLSLLFINKGWASEPIVEIEEVSISAFTLDGAMKPLLLQSFEEAAAYLDTKNLAVVKDKVDFSKQEILVFAWRGSGQDRITYEVLESFPEQIRFSYQPGRTRDLRPHVKVFVVRSDVKCIANGKMVSNLEIKEDGQWITAQLPQADLIERKAVEVRVRGILTDGIIAIGGETTGTIIRFGETTWELNLQNKKALTSAAGILSGKPVVVSGLVRTQKGIEVATRTILTVESIFSGLPRPTPPKVIVPERIMGKPFVK
tara:strand:+ start:81 stop:881 length:801 start_codon:yes stop_codon:yes gene_type:complete